MIITNNNNDNNKSNNNDDNDNKDNNNSIVILNQSQNLCGPYILNSLMYNSKFAIIFILFMYICNFLHI